MLSYGYSGKAPEGDVVFLWQLRQKHLTHPVRWHWRGRSRLPSIMGCEGNRKSEVGAKVKFYKSTITKEMEPVKTPFKVSHSLLPKLWPRRKISWRGMFCCSWCVEGAGNQGLAIDTAPYYVQCSICIIYFFIHISLLLIIISKLHLLMTKGVEEIGCVSVWQGCTVIIRGIYYFGKKVN